MRGEGAREVDVLGGVVWSNVIAVEKPIRSTKKSTSASVSRSSSSHEHGGICGTCNGCGIPDRVGETHAKWCQEKPGVTITAESFDAETDKIANEVMARFKRKGTVDF